MTRPPLFSAGRNGIRERMNGRVTAAVIAALVVSVLTTPLAAQTCDGSAGVVRPAGCPSLDESFRTSGELVTLGANALIGGLTAGVRQWRADASFLDAFWRGAIGGAGTYAGKRIVASDFTASGVLGRGVAAAGASVARNASEGRPMFDRLTIPVSFVRLHWRPATGNMQASLDLPGIAAIAGIYMSDLGASLDIARSLDTGAPVFLARDWTPERGWAGRQVLGAVLLRGDRPRNADHDRILRHALHHERVHVLQYDQIFILWNEPLETRVLQKLDAPDWLISRFDLSLIAFGLSGAKFALPGALHVWEDEAHFVARTGADFESR